MLLDHLKTTSLIFRQSGRVAGLVFLMGGLAACTNIFTNMANDESLKSKTGMNQTEYGMHIDPAVFRNGSLALQRGGGHAMVGKPYQIKGKWYYPAEDPDYAKTGLASWYGSAFHGKLTANGETFDMNHLTAAHPTMPLPSYARVTNIKNGSSLVVRVNDRGPFAHNRIIDLSRRAAQLLGYKNSGVTDVKVEYIGPAPVHGQDDSYLLASFIPSKDEDSSALLAFDDKSSHSVIQAGSSKTGINGPVTPVLPEYGPRIELKPALTSAFAGEAASATTDVFQNILTPDDERNSFNGVSAQGEYISVGTFSDPDEVRNLAATLSGYGQLESKVDKDDKGHIVYAVSLTGASSVNAALRAVWQAGATDAFVVRPQ